MTQPTTSTTRPFVTAEREHDRQPPAAGPAPHAGTSSDPPPGWGADRLIGRRSELEYLTDFLDRAQAGPDGAVLLITGEPGIGKTRLLREAAARVRRQGTAVDWTCLRPDDAKGNAAGLRELTSHRPAGADGRAGAERDARGRGARLRVVEDVQYAEDQTLTDLIHFAEDAREHGTVILLTCDDTVRSAALDEMRRSSTVPPLRLGELTAAQAEAMTRSRFPALAERPDVMSALHHWCGGVPLLIEEMADLMTGPGGGSGTGGGPSSFVPPIPPSLRARTGSLLTRLDETGRAVVRAASLLGPYFTWRAVQDVTACRAEAVQEALRAASDIGLLTPDPAQGPAGYRFRNRMAAAALCTEAIAHASAESVGLAADVLVARGRQAFDRGDAGLAQRLMEQAWLILAERPDRRSTLKGLFRDVASRSGDVFACERLHAAPEGADGSPGPVPSEARTLARLARLGGTDPRTPQEPVVMTGQHRDAVDFALRAAEEALAARRADQARRHARTALSRAFDLALPEAACDALDLLGQASMGHDAAGARRAYRRVHRIAEAHRLPYWEIRARVGSAAADLLATGVTASLDGLRESTERSGLHDLTAQIDLQRAWALILRGDFPEARERTEEAARRTHVLGLRTLNERARDLRTVAAALGRDDRDRPGPAEERAEATAEAILCLCSYDLAGFDRAVRDGGLGDPRTDTSQAHLVFPWYGMGLLVGAVLPEAPRVAATTVTTSFADRGLALYAKAVELGRSGEAERAAAGAREADRLLANADWLRHVARLCTAESALADGWGEPVVWLRQAVIRFSALGQEQLAHTARRFMRGTGEPVPRRGRGDSEVPTALARLGVTSREMDVLQLLSRGLRNKDIARRLLISPRTVETHVANLFAKAQCSDRQSLGALAELCAVPN